MKRPDDTVTIESLRGTGPSIFMDRATQYEVATSILQPSIARFELGDEATWGAIKDVIAIGSRYSVAINGQARVTGRMLTRNMPLSEGGGATVQLVVRTRLADAMFTVVDHTINVRAATLKDLILRGFAKLGATEDDFIFRGDLARDAITGRKSGQPSAAASINYRLQKLDTTTIPAGDHGAAQRVLHQKKILQQQLIGAETRPVVPDLAEITVQAAAPQPGESIYTFVDRHLVRHGYMMWDAADGKIVVGFPNDSQRPLYLMTCLKGDRSQANNLLNAAKTEDFEQVPTNLWVYGRAGSKGFMSSPVAASVQDPVLASLDPPIDRSVIIVDQGLKTQELAAARARKEMLMRSMSKDMWSLETDGLSYWDGRATIPFAVDTVADVQVDVSDRADGPYLIYESIFSGNADGGHTTKLSAIGKGIWVQ